MSVLHSVSASLYCSLPMDPEALSLLFVLINEDPLAMHLALFPLSCVLSSISPLKNSIAMSLVILELSLVGPPVWPGVGTISIHVVFKPFTLILSAVKPPVLPLPLHLVIDPISRVDSSVRPIVGPHPILLAIIKKAFKLGAICPSLNSMATVQVVLPVAHIATLAVGINVRPVAVCFVILPVAFIGVAIGYPELALPTGEVLEPFALVLGAIRPSLDSIGAFATIFVHVAAVDCLLLYLHVFDILKLVLFNQSFEPGNLLLRSTVILALDTRIVEVQIKVVHGGLLLD